MYSNKQQQSTKSQSQLQIIQNLTQIQPHKYLSTLTHSSKLPLLQIFSKINIFIQNCSIYTILQNTRQLIKILKYYIKKIQKYKDNANIFNILSLIRNNIDIKVRQYQQKLNNFNWLTFLLKIIHRIEYIIEGSIKKQGIQQNKIGIHFKQVEQTVRLQFYQKNFENFQPIHMENINQNLVNLTKNGYKYPNQSCIGCWHYQLFKGKTKQYNILAIKQGIKFPNTQQLTLVVKLIKNPSFIEQIKNGICAILNSGGGYLFLNGSQQKIVKGIKQNEANQVKQDVFRSIQGGKSLLRPSSDSFHIFSQFLYTMDHPSDRICQNFNNDQDFTLYYQSILTKLVIRVTILPKIPFPSSKSYHPTLYYQQQKLKSNKFVYPTFISQQNIIKKIQQQKIYNILTKFAQKSIRSNFKCLECFKLINIDITKQLQNIEIEQIQQSSDQPNVTRYKKCTVIVITSPKYQKLISQKIPIMLKQKKQPFSFIKPYKKYTQSSLRPIWYINHNLQFNILNNLIKQKIDQNLYRAIIVTKILKVIGYPDNQKFKRMGNIVKLTYNVQYPKCKTKQNIIYTIKKNKKSQINYYYKFEDLKHSILGYIYLDGVGQRTQFVKQDQFPQQKQEDLYS